ncbi:MAG TPA: hypothetical protein VE173_08735, partial [Longimicrobiales bacterium]|nr:hypothetical protein [Longimicrobiales bacterium]
PGDRGVNVFVSKHFRYAYQREFRFVWKPPGRVDGLQPVMLNLDLKEAGVRTELIPAFGA